jgi:hypothetical protein
MTDEQTDDAIYYGFRSGDQRAFFCDGRPGLVRPAAAEHRHER